MRNQLVELENLRTKLGAQLASNLSLPEAYDNYMSHFQHFLSQLMKAPIVDLKTGTFGSPPLRKFFSRVPPRDPHSSLVDLQSKPRSQIPSLPKIIPLINYLFDEQQCFLMGRHNVLDEIDRLLRHDTKECGLVSTWVSTHLSEMGIISEFLRQLDFHQPRIGFNTSINEEDRYSEFNRKMQPLIQLHQAITARGAMELADVGTPITGRFDYPVHERASESTVTQMRKAEAELDAFWAKFDGHMKRRIGQHPNQLFAEFVGERKVERTSEWVSPTPIPASEPQVTKPSPRDELGSLHLKQSIQEPGTEPEQAGAKVKVKTRGVPNPDFTPSISRPLSFPSPDPSLLTPIMVTPRAHKVFTRVFFTPSPDRTPGEVPWTDFLYAMTTAGCSAKRLMGSAWMFARPESQDGVVPKTGGPIIFHEPHPTANIPIRHVRKHGRRLSRRWGWSIDSFAVESVTREAINL